MNTNLFMYILKLIAIHQPSVIGNAIFVPMAYPSTCMHAKFGVIGVHLANDITKIVD